MMAETINSEERTGEEENDVKREPLKTNISSAKSNISDDASIKSDISEHHSQHRDRPLTSDPLSDLTDNQRVVLYTMFLYGEENVVLHDDIFMGDVDVWKTLKELEDRELVGLLVENKEELLSVYFIPSYTRWEIMESYRENCLLSDIDKEFFVDVVYIPLYYIETESNILNLDVSSPQDKRSLMLMRLVMEGKIDREIQLIG
ncbi:uncharacterized protein LOC134261525, partial [Saccostrea cucullata]|uniref:uncharacterized protein LOC134261525 n=1 Tax=Saccostrea cuccullata TaxID=36930 RepID=UPI002ED61612